MEPKFLLNERPLCSKCAMHMIATSAVKNNTQNFECLRCGNLEVRMVIDHELTRQTAWRQTGSKKCFALLLKKDSRC